MPSRDYIETGYLKESFFLLYMLIPDMQKQF